MSDKPPAIPHDLCDMSTSAPLDTENPNRISFGIEKNNAVYYYEYEVVFNDGTSIKCVSEENLFYVLASKIKHELTMAEGYYTFLGVIVMISKIKYIKMQLVVKEA